MRAFLASDLAEINSWRAARGMRELAAREVPALGFLEPGVAAGFVLQTDTCVAIMDGYVTNPAAGLRARGQAVKDITRALLDAAKVAGSTAVVAFCTAAGTARSAVRFGLKVTSTPVVLSREL